MLLGNFQNVNIMIFLKKEQNNINKLMNYAKLINYWSTNRSTKYLLTDKIIFFKRNKNAYSNCENGFVRIVTQRFMSIF